jgi:hypothetical protein
MSARHSDSFCAHCFHVPTGAFTQLKFRSGVRAYAGVFSLVFSVGQLFIDRLKQLIFLVSII